MSAPEQPDSSDWVPEFLEEMRSRLNEISVVELTDALVSTGLRKGGTFSKWTEFRLGLLKDFHITADIQRLVEWGINKETLNVSLFFINLAPMLDYFFKEMFGDKRTRLRNARSLATAAAVLENMSKLVPGMPDTFGKIPSLDITANGVKHYASMLVWGETAYEFIGANSLVEVTKYALAGLVKNKTGKFHDREVSALTGAALQKFDYDETAHRVWRIRNYGRLEKSFPIAPRFLHAFDNALSQGS
jgi:hypothetical protein